MTTTTPELDAAKRKAEIAAIKNGDRMFSITCLSVILGTISGGYLLHNPGTFLSIQRVTGREAFRRDTSAKMFAGMISPIDANIRLGWPATLDKGRKWEGRLSAYCRLHLQ